MNSFPEMVPLERGVLEGPLWEALWPPHVRSRNSIGVPVTAPAWDDAGKYGPYCELFFLLMRLEPDLTE